MGVSKICSLFLSLVLVQGSGHQSGWLRGQRKTEKVPSTGMHLLGISRNLLGPPRSPAALPQIPDNKVVEESAEQEVPLSSLASENSTSISNDDIPPDVIEAIQGTPPVSTSTEAQQSYTGILVALLIFSLVAAAAIIGAFVYMQRRSSFDQLEGDAGAPKPKEKVASEDKKPNHKKKGPVTPESVLTFDDEPRAALAKKSRYDKLFWALGKRGGFRTALPDHTEGSSATDTNTIDPNTKLRNFVVPGPFDDKPVEFPPVKTVPGESTQATKAISMEEWQKLCEETKSVASVDGEILSVY